MSDIQRWIDATNSNPARAKRAPLELASDVVWSLLGRPLPRDIYQKYLDEHRDDRGHQTPDQRAQQSYLDTYGNQRSPYDD